MTRRQLPRFSTPLCETSVLGAYEPVCVQKVWWPKFRVNAMPTSYEAHETHQHALTTNTFRFPPNKSTRHRTPTIPNTEP